MGSDTTNRRLPRYRSTVTILGVTPRSGVPLASAPLEVDALVDRQTQEVAAQAVQPHLDGACTHPVAASDQPCLARHRRLGIGDADADRSTEIGPVGALVEIDQERQG